MATKSNRLVPARAIHPGEILREELQERGIKQKDLAKLIDVQPTHLSEFIKGKRNMTEELAMKLEAQLGISFKSWMNLHNGYIYDIKRINARKAEEQEAVEYEAACDAIFNLKILYKRLDMNLLSVVERVKRLKKLFSFDLLVANELRLQVSGLYKHSEKVQIDEKNMLTWLLLNYLAAVQMPKAESYAKGNGLKAAEEIAKMANDRIANVYNIKECLNHYGITYIEVEKVEKAPVDAYSSKKDGNPIITVTYRYNDMDKLVFDILHELCHVENHFSEGQAAFISIDGADYSTDPFEIEANEFAKNMLIPEKVWNNILKSGCKNLSPYQIVKTIAGEAEKRGISPSIAISRYKHDSNWYKTSVYKSPKIY